MNTQDNVIGVNMDSIINYKFNFSHNSKYNPLGEDFEQSTDVDSNIVFSKLNPTTISSNEIKEESKNLSETMNSQQRMIDDIYCMNSNIMKKKYKTEFPTECYYSKKYSFMKCENIITYKIDDIIFSILNNPRNDDEFFYLKMNNKSRFYMIEENEYNNIYFNNLNITYDELLEIVDNLNDLTEGIINEYDIIKRRKFKLYFMKVSITLIITIIFSIISYFCKIFFSIKDQYITFIFYVLVAILIIILLFLIISNLLKRDNEYNMFKLLLSKQTEVEDCINQWSKNKYFKGTIIVPQSFKYIQFSYNKVKIIISDHDI